MHPICTHFLDFSKVGDFKSSSIGSVLLRPPLIVIALWFWILSRLPGPGWQFFHACRTSSLLSMCQIQGEVSAYLRPQIVDGAFTEFFAFSFP